MKRLRHRSEAHAFSNHAAQESSYLCERLERRRFFAANDPVIVLTEGLVRNPNAAVDMDGRDKGGRY